MFHNLLVPFFSFFFLEKRLHEDSTKTQIGCRLRTNYVALAGNICKLTLFGLHIQHTAKYSFLVSLSPAPNSASLHDFRRTGQSIRTGQVQRKKQKDTYSSVRGETGVQGYYYYISRLPIIWYIRLVTRERMLALKFLWKLCFTLRASFNNL